MVSGFEIVLPFVVGDASASETESVARIVGASVRDWADVVRLHASDAVNIDAARDRAISALVALHELGDQRPAVWLVGAPRVLRDLLALPLSSRYIPLVTARIRSSQDACAFPLLAEIAAAQRVPLEFDSDQPANEAMLAGLIPRPMTGDAALYAYTKGAAIMGDGRIVASNDRSSTLRVHVDGLDPTLRELDLDWNAFRGGRYMPGIVDMPEPTGEATPCYVSMGTQAFAAWMEHQNARAALGFKSDQAAEFEGWLRAMAGETATDYPFPVFLFGHPDWGMIGAGEPAFPPRGNPERLQPKFEGNALAVAGWIVQGRLAEARHCLGVPSKVALVHEKAPMSTLPPDEQQDYLDRAAGMLAAAIAIVVMSRAPAEKRQEAAIALVDIATPDAWRSLRQLRRCQREAVERALTKKKRRSARARARDGKNDAAAKLMNITAALDRLEATFGKEAR